jgi:hypothetical protein
LPGNSHFLFAFPHSTFVISYIYYNFTPVKICPIANSKVAELDILRAIAALAVIAIHITSRSVDIQCGTLQLSLATK